MQWKDQLDTMHASHVAEIDRLKDHISSLQHEQSNLIALKSQAEERELYIQEELHSIARNTDGKQAVISILEGVNVNLEGQVQTLTSQIQVTLYKYIHCQYIFHF